jgi:hypothetical protein
VVTFIGVPEVRKATGMKTSHMKDADRVRAGHAHASLDSSGPHPKRRVLAERQGASLWLETR